MKKFILLTISILFLACQQPTDSIAIVKTDDDKTQAIQKMFENYMAYGTDSYDADYDLSIVSDDLTGNNSIPGFEVNKASFIATDSEHHALFDNISMWLPGSDDGIVPSWQPCTRYRWRRNRTPVRCESVFYHRVHPFVTGMDFLSETPATNRLTRLYTHESVAPSAHLNS